MRGGLLIALMLIQAREVVVHIRDAGIDGQRVLIGFECLEYCALVFEDDTEIERRDAVPGVDTQGLSIKLLGSSVRPVIVQ